MGVTGGDGGVIGGKGMDGVGLTGGGGVELEERVWME